jgi:hypothetical protein
LSSNNGTHRRKRSIHGKCEGGVRAVRDVKRSRQPSTQQVLLKIPQSTTTTQVRTKKKMKVKREVNGPEPQSTSTTQVRTKKKRKVKREANGPEPQGKCTK